MTSGGNDYVSVAQNREDLRVFKSSLSVKHAGVFAEILGFIEMFASVIAGIALAAKGNAVLGVAIFFQGEVFAAFLIGFGGYLRMRSHQARRELVMAAPSAQTTP